MNAPEHGAVRLEVDRERAEIVLDRPGKRNALTPEMLDELAAAIAEVADSDARAVVLRGAGEKAFCVGADIDRFSALSPVQMWRDWTARGHRVFDALAGLRIPTVAVVHAAAFGGGLEIAMACDFRIIAAEATVGLPEVGLGTVPGWGGTGRLTELVGRARAKELVLARRTLTGTEAYGWGLASEAPDASEVDSAVGHLVARLCDGAPIAVQLAKQLINAAADGAPHQVLETIAGGLTSSTEDLAEGVLAFRERRTPVFQGR